MFVQSIALPLVCIPMSGMPACARIGISSVESVLMWPTTAATFSVTASRAQATATFAFDCVLHVRIWMRRPLMPPFLLIASAAACAPVNASG